MPCREYADSKTLTDEKREQLFTEIEGDEDVGFAVDNVTAADISSQMLRRCHTCLSCRLLSLTGITTSAKLKLDTNSPL